MRRASPRRLERALAPVRDDLGPRTTLALVQSVWRSVAGAALAREAEPTHEQAGTLTISCRSAVWAQELELLSLELCERLNEALRQRPGAQPIKAIRASAHRPPSDR